jgi:endonuclease/exonuclease/phosphatase family metal-dependent hydrolase
MNLVEILKEDYCRFPLDQTYRIYAEDVFFKDPVTEFRGIARYQQMLGLMNTWFKSPKMDLHDIQQSGNRIKTRWTLSWTTPLPWQPRIAIKGRSELELNEEGLITAHLDYWDCSRMDVLKQHFSF